MFRTRLLLCGLAALVVVSSANAQTDIEFRLVAVSTPTASDTVNPTLPGSITDVCDGDIYYIELWTSDVGTTNTGVSSAYVDLTWSGAAATADSVNHGGLYTSLTGGTIGGGLVDELGGSYLSATGAAISPEWARVAYVQLTANAAGSTVFSLGQSTTGVAALGRGEIAWTNIDITSSVTITVQGNATADAGVDQTICEGGTATMAGVATNSSGCTWSTSGNGLFDDATLLAAVYTPGTTDISTGSATLTLTCSAVAPCGTAAADTMVVTVDPAPATPTALSATLSTICEGGTSTLDATVGAGEEVDWYTGSCGGTLVGTGSIVVSPTVTTSYYARAQNVTTLCESLLCDQLTVTVDYCISGNVSTTNVSPAPIPGVTVTESVGGASDTTDVNGDYLLTVPLGSTGNVTACSDGWRFSAGVSFTNISASITNADFTGTLVYDLDPDDGIGVGDFSLFTSSWQFTVGAGADVLHDFDCDNFVGVADFSYFVTAWSKSVFDGTIIFPACQLCGGARSGTGLEPVQLELRLVAVATPTLHDLTRELPESVTQMEVGQSYYVEMWVRDLDGRGPGVTSVYADVGLPLRRSLAQAVWANDVFAMFTSGSIGKAIVRDLGGSAVEAGVGTNHWWALVATIEVEAIGGGSVSYELRESPVGLAAYGRGLVPWNSVEALGVTVDHARREPVRPRKRSRGR